jgi:hypothetical protein
VELQRWLGVNNNRKVKEDKYLKMEAVCFSEMVVSAYESTWRRNPEEQRGHISILVSLGMFMSFNQFLEFVSVKYMVFL